MVRVIIFCFLCLPVTFVLFILLTMSQGGGTNALLRLMSATLALWTSSLLLGPVGGVIFQKLKWRWATWISVAVPLTLSLAMVVMLILFFTGAA
ncbi:hypothetical protein [Brevundimonas sp. NIBR10]|uniref:hypothetical protein n=1 Tax=Brevundimonas sp. NIBR10 TaxID=3015997 RepID=UPI0022F1A41F|nr:hypothetical protein [Brevundimonas sp. NIBR10]